MKLLLFLYGFLMMLNAAAQCEPAALPYIENFESVQIPFLPDCSSSTAITENTNLWQVVGIGTGEDVNKVLQFSSASSLPFGGLIESVFESRPLALKTDKFYAVTFIHNVSNDALKYFNLRVQFKNIATGAIVGIVYMPNFSSETQQVFSTETATVPEDGIYTFQLELQSGTNVGELNIDTIVIGEMICPVPTGLSVTGVTDRTASFSWEGDSPATYQYSVVPVGEDPQFSMPTGMPVATRTGLQPETNYTVYVRKRCGNTPSYYWSDWSGGVDFTTSENTLGLTDVDKTDFLLYPNPAATTLTISYSEKINRIEIYNTVGQLVHYEAPNDLISTFYIQHLSSGIYYLMAYSDDFLIKKQLIKE